MKCIGIFGTSGHARELGDIVHDLGYRAIYVARDLAERNAWLLGDECMVESDVGQYRDMEFVIGIGENAVRQKVALRYINDLTFANLIHPSATFGTHQRHAVEIKKGVVICAGVRLANNITIGDFSIFNRNATIGHDGIVEDYVHVAPGACISGNVHLSIRCWIGTGTVINQGSNHTKLLVGADTVVGSGAVVVKSCEANAVYVGVPAKRIK